MGVTFSLSRRALFLAASLVISAGPVLLFLAPASASTYGQTSTKNAGTPNSTTVVKKNGVIVSYGNKYITYKVPSSSLDGLGEALFLENCASCHGSQANGVPAKRTVGAYPDLLGLGPANIEFSIDSGR